MPQKKKAPRRTTPRPAAGDAAERIAAALEQIANHLVGLRRDLLALEKAVRGEHRELE